MKRPCYSNIRVIVSNTIEFLTFFFDKIIYLIQKNSQYYITPKRDTETDGEITPKYYEGGNQDPILPPLCPSARHRPAGWNHGAACDYAGDCLRRETKDRARSVYAISALHTSAQIDRNSSPHLCVCVCVCACVVCVCVRVCVRV
jgi:hypothetical protein